MLRVKLLGTFALTTGDDPPFRVTLRDATTQALLKYLLVQRGQTVAQDALIELFWPGSEPEAGRASLQAAISHIRHALEPAQGAAGRFIVRQPPGYRFDQGLDCDIDHERYLAWAQMAATRAAQQDWPGVLEAVQSAEALVTGDLLACEPYADWAEAARTEFGRRRAALLDLALTAQMHLRRWHDVVNTARVAITADRLREGPYRHLMMAYGSLHEPALALSAYEECRSALSEELGLEPEPATKALRDEILHAERPSQAARHNLPTPVSSFIGREKDLTAVRQMLTGGRLVTLTGPGGCGKTRLALQVATGLVEQFPDGVWLVELAPLRLGEDIPYAIASAIGLLEELAGPIPQALTRHLAARRMLLVLDNCEHLVEPAAFLAESLLGAAAGLRVLTTSREPLCVGGEAVWRVQPFDLPDLDRLPALEDLAAFDGIRFFAERAVLGRPDFRLDEANAWTVASICCRLDGIPLALELAAARLRTLSEGEILARLGARFQLLTGGSRTALPRHQTLLALVDWSYQLLTEPERILWRRLAVFAGRFSLNAVITVCRHSALEGEEMLDLLSRLADRSLVTAEYADGETVYRLLETMREFALTKLRASGEESMQRRSHRDWCMAIAAEANLHLIGPDRLRWIRYLGQYQEDLRAAMLWSRQQGEVETELQMVSDLTNYWASHPVWIHYEWVSELLDLAGDRAAVRLRAKVLQGAGSLACLRGDCAAAIRRYSESLELRRQLGFPQGIANGLASLAFVALHQGDYERAAAWLDEALALGRNLVYGHPLIIRGMVALFQGHLDEAVPYLEEALKLQQELGDRSTTAHALLYLGLAALYRREAAAGARLGQALALFQGVGDESNTAWTLVNLGRLAQQQQDWAGAAAHYRNALMLYRKLYGVFKIGQADCLEGLAGLAAALGNGTKAARLFGAAARIRAHCGMPLPPVARAEYERMEAGVQEAFAGARAEGWEMSLPEALDYALATDEETGALVLSSRTDGTSG
ncbi:MAG TPA: BTAD domain-containing putative transcriptional regulator [Symbiobacteriaceae bacterium]|nr:BTAD domain-containing putative transcriptional regulator [Symbiobacteriaceae bacterium]